MGVGGAREKRRGEVVRGEGLEGNTGGRKGGRAREVCESQRSGEVGGGLLVGE